MVPLSFIFCFFIASTVSESDPIHTVVIKPSIKHAPPKPIPVISHASSPDHHSGILTDQKCHVEEVELYAEVCTPTIEKECENVKVKTQTIQSKEDCVEVVRTVCNETEEVVDNEVCYYVYNMEKTEAKATTVEVEFTRDCVDETQNVCAKQKWAGYGGHCKEVNNEICYNAPGINPSETTVTVGIPVPEKKCVNKQVKLPKIKCGQVSEKKCFQLPYTMEETQNLARCTTKLGHPRCEQTPIKLPRQVCVTKPHKKISTGKHA